MPKIYVCVGMISSGKSTYCKNAAKTGMIICNDDDIVNLCHAHDYTLYDEKLKVLYKGLENALISHAISLNKSVVVDRGVNVSERGRKRWTALAQSFDVPCEAIVFFNEGPEIHAQRRAFADARGHDYDYWLMVAKHHDSIYEEPRFDEGFSRLHYISWLDIQEGKTIL